MGVKSKPAMSPRSSAGGIVVGADGRILLVEQHGNSWSFPKGGVEAGESELEAARREIYEETGVQDLVLIGALGSYVRRSIGLEGKGENTEWPATRRTFFLFKTTGAALAEKPQDPDGEITAVRFVTIGEALALLSHQKDCEFLESIRDRLS